MLSFVLSLISAWNSCDTPNVCGCLYSCVCMYMCEYGYKPIHICTYACTHTYLNDTQLPMWMFCDLVLSRVCCTGPGRGPLTRWKCLLELGGSGVQIQAYIHDKLEICLGFFLWLLCMCICEYVCVLVHVCIWIYTHTCNIHTHTKRNGWLSSIHLNYMWLRVVEIM